jgi:arsenate reductase-like glutaredoxin family protein
MEEQQMELEQLIEIAENLKNDIIKLHNQEQELIESLNKMKNSRISLLNNIYSFISNTNLLLFGMKNIIQ